MEYNVSVSLYLKVKDTGILTVISPQERKRQEVRVCVCVCVCAPQYIPAGMS